MKLAESMPTFVRLFQAGSQSLAAMPRRPYVAFLVASVIATVIWPLACILSSATSMFLKVMLFLFVPVWLPVFAGDLALLFWSRKQSPFRPSLMLRLLMLSLVMEGFFLIYQYRNPPKTLNEETMNEVVFMSIWGTQCVLLLIIEPGLRWLLRRRMSSGSPSF